MLCCAPGPVVLLPRAGDDLAQHVLQRLDLLEAHAQPGDDLRGHAGRLLPELAPPRGEADQQGALVGGVALPLDQPGVLEPLEQRVARLEAENAALRAETTKLTTEREILQRAAKYFAGETRW